MDIKEEVKTEESKANEDSVTDLTVTDEQSDSTKGGNDVDAAIARMSFVTRPIAR